MSNKVSIGLIDSGLSSNHTHLMDKVVSCYDAVEKCKIDKIFLNDKIGHGTACAAAIANEIDEFDLHVIKVFDDQLTTNSKHLISALKHCFSLNLDIVNISMGSLDFTYEKEINELCNRLYEEKYTLVIAAGNNTGTKCLPACLKSVIQVDGRADLSIGEIDIDANKKIVYGYSGRRRLEWKDGGKNIVDGESFLCAEVTGKVASVYIVGKKNLYKDIFERLLPGKNLLNNSLNLVNMHREENVNNFFEISNAIIYPYNKEMESLIRYRELLDFKITNVVDLILKGDVGKDVAEIIGIDKSGIILKSNLNYELSREDVDTLILGDLSELSRLYSKNLCVENTLKAFNAKKNVVSIELLDEDDYKYLKKEAVAQGRGFFSLNTLSEEWNGKISPQVGRNFPIVGIYGTGPKVGKFSLQILLDKYMSKIGYKVSIVSTEPQGFLFGHYSLPLGNLKLLSHIAFENQIDAIRNITIKAIQNEKPEILFIGGQSSFVPLDKSIATNFNSLTSIMTMLAVKPDSSILCVSPSDSIEYIKRTICAIESFGYGVVGLIVVSNFERTIVQKRGVNRIQKRHLSTQELVEVKNHLKQEFDIDVADIITNEGVRQIIKSIISRYSSKQNVL